MIYMAQFNGKLFICCLLGRTLKCACCNLNIQVGERISHIKDIKAEIIFTVLHSVPVSLYYRNIIDIIDETPPWPRALMSCPFGSL